MRCFLAVQVPEEAKEKISELIPSLQGGAFKIVPQQNMHLTMKFLSELDDALLEKVKQAVAPAAARHSPFQATLQGVGAFPSENYIKVLWVGITPKADYVSLQKEIDLSLKPIGFRPERDYRPHLTIARVREVSDKPKLQQFISSHKTSPFGPVQVSSVSLMQSQLGKGAPVYSELEIFKLGGESNEN